jgi:hypothetical protein
VQTIDLLASGPLRHGISCILLGVALLMVWSMIPHGIQAIASIGTTADIPTRPDPGTTVLRVESLHIFGQSATDATAAPVAPLADIKVAGLIYSDDKDSALAILEVNGKSDFFKVGDTLPDGEKLTAIAPNAVQLNLGTAQRVIELPEQFNGPGDGILLAGDTGLIPGESQFPGLALTSGGETYKPALRAIAMPRGASPLDQLRSLRQQLIPQRTEIAPSDPAKHPAKP